jgi:hypothetical protein
MAAMDSGKGIERLGPKGWLGITIRLLSTFFLLLLLITLSHCGPSILPVDTPASVALPMTGTPTMVGTPATGAASARLTIDVRPRGAKVIVDGLRSGTTPVSLELPAGQHTVRVEMDDHESLAQIILLVPGDEAVVSGELARLPADVEPTLPSTKPSAPTLTPTPTPVAPQSLPDLAIRSVAIELETGGACDYTSTHLGLAVVVENTGDGDAGPFAVEAASCQQMVNEGLAAGQMIRLWFSECGYGYEQAIVVDALSQVEESDKENNVFTGQLPIPTLPPTCTPPPSPPTATPVPVPAVNVREGQVTIPTYPYADFTTTAWNETFNLPYAILDWQAYESSNPVPQDVVYRTLEMENEYLKLTFLPDVGGRLYEILYKPTGHHETYRNPVLKPSPWGPAEQGWWLAAGGLEWCLPVEEHGYEWGVPWQLAASRDLHSANVTLRDAPEDASGDDCGALCRTVRATVVVRLESGASDFTIQVHLENLTDAPLDVKYWTNAMLAPGGQNAPSAGLRFVLPDAASEVTVHSRGDESLPGYNERMSWPVFDGVDYSRLGNWNRWLGFFEDPAMGDFIAVYDENYDEGLVRVFPAAVAQGAKGFAFGWDDPIHAINWTDDGSSYIEVHGGPAPTFDDSVTLPAGGHLQWTETWYPVAGLGGLCYANETAALNLEAGDGQAHVAVGVSRPWSGDVVLQLDDQALWRQGVSLVPGQPFRQAVLLGDAALSSGRLALRLETPDGEIVAEYSAEFISK